jgi:hypothetical protein
MTHVERFIPYFLVLVYLFRLAIINHLPLAPDEAHYWYWSKNLQLSYFDHPPMVAYIMALFTWIGGDNEFSVRVGGLLCTLIALLFVYLAAKKLSRSNKELSWEILFVLNITVLFSAACIIQTPDTPLLLFWALAVYCGSQIITGGAASWWYVSGVALGLGLLSKYTMILLAPCMFAFLLYSRLHRYWLLRKEPYCAILLGLLVFSPVVLWNSQHHWISFAFQLGQGFSPIEGSAVSKLLRYIGGQIGVVTPGLFLVFVYYSLLGVYIARKKGIAEYLYLAFMCWPSLIFFGVSTLRGEVAEANWPAPAYVAGLPMMWIVFRQYFGERRVHRTFICIAVGLALALNLLIHIHVVRPIIPLSPKLDTTKQLYGWRELGENINSYIEKYPWKDGYFLVADRGITTVAEAVFYTGNRLMGLDFFRPEEYTFLRNIDQLKGKNAIILLNDFTDYQLNRYRPYFKEVMAIGENTFSFRGESLKLLSLRVVLGKEFLGNWRPVIEVRR